MRKEWQREGRDTSDWLIVVFADDIFICAPPQIAARLYAHIAYVAKRELNLEFKDDKTKFASMGDTETLTKSLKTAFSKVQDHHTEEFPILPVVEEFIKTFKVLPGMDVLGVPVGTMDYRIAGVLCKFVKTKREWALANSYASNAQTRFNVLHHCLRTTFTHLIRALGPAVFSSMLGRRHFDECNSYVARNNAEDAKEGNLRLLKEVEKPAEEVSLGEYIDTWLRNEAMTVTGIPANEIPTEDKIRFTYPRREGGFGFTKLMDQVHGAYVGLFLESLYPEGLTDTADSEAKGFGLRAISSVVNRYLPHHSHTDRIERVRGVSRGSRGLLPFSEVTKYFQPYDFDLIDENAPAALRTLVSASKKLAEMPHVRNLMLNNKVFKSLRSTIPGGTKWTWIHHPEWLGPVTSKHLQHHGESRVNLWSDFQYATYDGSHLDNGPEERHQEEQSGQARTLHDGPRETTGAIPHFQEGAVQTSTTTTKGRSSRLQSNAALPGSSENLTTAIFFKKRMAMSQKLPFVSIAKECTEGVDSPP